VSLCARRGLKKGTLIISGKKTLQLKSLKREKVGLAGKEAA
jgi:hypothetical protein